MKSVILCEGSTDYFLLQYYMRKAYQWKDDRTIQDNIIRIPHQKSRNLTRNSDLLTIMSVGGCSRMVEGLETVIKYNFLSPPDLSEIYQKIVVVTDRDEVGTEEDFIRKVSDLLQAYDIVMSEGINNNSWFDCQMKNQVGITENFSLLLLIIPFDETGAMETFLLNAISDKDAYDKMIIDYCNEFVEHIDPQKKYLTSRRYTTKAKFDTYFSVRTPVEQFVERQNILKNVNWEEYSQIQTSFRKLEELNTPLRKL